MCHRNQSHKRKLFIVVGSKWGKREVLCGFFYINELFIQIALLGIVDARESKLYSWWQMHNLLPVVAITKPAIQNSYVEWGSNIPQENVIERAQCFHFQASTWLILYLKYIQTLGKFNFRGQIEKCLKEEKPDCLWLLWHQEN